MGLIDSIFNVGSQALTNKANLQATRETNAANYRIAQMNNDYNQRMMEKQMQYNIDMWNAQNEYNSPTAQKQRLREAGVPAWMMSGDAGSASSAGSVSAPTAQNVTMQAPHFDAPTANDLTSDILGILSARGVIHDNRIKAEQARALQIDNQTRSLQNLYSLENLKGMAEGQTEKNAYQRLLNSTFMDTWNADMNIKKQSYENLKVDNEIKMIQKMEGDVRLAFLPDQLRQDLAYTAAQILQTHATTDKTRAELRKVVMETILTKYKAQHEKVDARVAARVADYVVDTAYQTSLGVRYDNRNKIYQNVGLRLDNQRKKLNMGFDSYENFLQYNQDWEQYRKRNSFSGKLGTLYRTYKGVFD